MPDLHELNEALVKEDCKATGPLALIQVLA
jgi:hypothetical protein